jgi:hypothetical protein
MNDEDLTGPSRVAWQLIGLAVLLVVIVVYGVAPFLAEAQPPYDSGVRQVVHLNINGADVTICPPGAPWKDAQGHIVKVRQLGKAADGMDHIDIPKGAVCSP